MIFYILEEVNDSNFSKGTVIPHKKILRFYHWVIPEKSLKEVGH